MRNVNKNIKLVVVMALVLIEITSIFFMVKAYSNKNNELAQVKLLSNGVNNDMFVIMIEQDGEYVEDEDSVWPEDKIFNEDMSGCMDVDGKKLENALTYNDNINRAYVKTNKEAFCYLYFDAMIEDVELAYTGDYQEYIAKSSGYYYIEAYGAQGGGTSELSGALGGYTSGIVYLKAGEKLYIYVGEHTLTSTTSFNGGGIAYSIATGAGGGATDIRYFGEHEPTDEELVWDSELGLNSRIMVAGGGGGAYSETMVRGYGGGLIGGTGYDPNYPSYSATGGTQTSGGIVTNYSVSYTAGTNGSFGIGGSGGGAETGGGASGGGGYYGGAGGSRLSNGAWPSGGGSSFISGFAGVNAITSSSDRTHTNNTLHYSGKYFIDGKMKSGVNEGNGKAKISFHGKNAPERVNEGLNKVRYIKDCMNGNNINNQNHWIEIQAIYNGENVAKDIIGTLYDSSGNSIAEYNSTTRSYKLMTDGDISSTDFVIGATYTGLQCFVIDLGAEYDLEEVAVWHYWTDNRVYYENITYTSSDNAAWTEIIETTEPEVSEGKRINAYEYYIDTYTYTGAEENITLENSGCYQFELWGAQGGSTTDSAYYGGKGGYTYGTKMLDAGTTLYINVGGSGAAGGGTSVTRAGGYNGGGNGIISYTSTVYVGGGGGATHIATASGLLSSLSNNVSSVIAVAGGGGGSTYNDGGYQGGHAGGYIGNNGNTTTYSSYSCQAQGGGQSSGSANWCGSITTSFGLGGDALQQNVDTSYTYSAGGGGGWYGGGSNWGQSDVPGTGAGGSGYIGGMNTDGSSYMYCYSCTPSSDNATLTYSTTYYSSYAIRKHAKNGNGEAIIYYLGKTCS